MRKSLQRSQNCGRIKPAVSYQLHSPQCRLLVTQINPLLVPKMGV